MEDRIYKIPKEVYEWLEKQGVFSSNTETGKTHCMIPFWFEMVDSEKHLVKEYNFKNLPKEVREIHDEYLNIEETWKNSAPK